MRAVLEDLDRRKRSSWGTFSPLCSEYPVEEAESGSNPRDGHENRHPPAARFIFGCSGLHIVTVYVGLMRRDVRGLGVDYAAARFLLDKLAQLRLRLLCAADLFVQFGA